MAEEKSVERYRRLDPVGNTSNLQSLLDANQASLTALLPRHVTPERLMRTVLVAVNKTPLLKKCTQESLIEAIQRAGELGLDLSGTLGDGYLVPFLNTIKVNGKDQKLYQAQFMIGYRGLARLARQSGEIARMEAEVVYENDHFNYEKGANFKLEYKPLLKGNRGKPIGCYAFVMLKDGSPQADYMTVQEVEKVRAMSKSANSLGWTKFWGEMAKKTVFKRLAKWLPLSGEKFQAALAADNDEFDLDQLSVIDVTPGKTKTESLAARLMAESGPDPDDEPEPEDEANRGPGDEPEEGEDGMLSKAQIGRLRLLMKKKGLASDEGELVESIGYEGDLSAVPAAEFETLLSILDTPEGGE